MPAPDYDALGVREIPAPPPPKAPEPPKTTPEARGWIVDGKAMF